MLHGASIRLAANGGRGRAGTMELGGAGCVGGSLYLCGICAAGITGRTGDDLMRAVTLLLN